RMLKHYLISAPPIRDEKDKTVNRDWEWSVTVIIKHLIAYAQARNDVKNDNDNDNDSGMNGDAKRFDGGGTSWYNTYSRDEVVERQLKYLWEESPQELWGRLQHDCANAMDVVYTRIPDDERNQVMILMKEVVIKILKLRLLIQRHPMIH
ncbi:hypothetical protein RFI_20595, partial [Reticulomyxa filosa]